MSQSTFNSQVPQFRDYTRTDYVKAVLTKAGWPDTADNEKFLLNLAQREHAVGDSRPQAAFNLFNSEQPMPGSTFFNHTSANAGVQNYTTFDQGVDAAVQTLTNGNYKNIVASLTKGTAASDDAAGKFTKDLSTWSGGGYTTVSHVSGGDGPLAAPALSPTSDSSQTGGADIDGFLKTQAPKIAAALSDPTVKNLLNQWASNQLTDAEFQNQLEATDWWKNTPASARQRLVDEATDPATATQNLNQHLSYVNTLAATKGIGLPAGVAQQIALHIINDGWTTDRVQQEVAKYAKYQGNITYKGEAGVDVQQLRNLYASYALPVSDATLNTQLQQVLGGLQTIDDLKQGVAQKAKSLYGTNPDLASALDRGETVDQYMSTYADYAANLLGVDPQSINWLDPKWNVALTGTTDPSTGQTTGMSMAQWGQTLRTKDIYGYDNSQNGVDTASQFANQLVSKLTGAGV